MTTNLSPTLQLNNGDTMPALGLGVAQSSPEDTAEAVRTAIEAGYRLIDTAAAYGNEREVGEGIRQSGIDRKELFVTTKLWVTDFGEHTTRSAFETSLEKLGLDYVDLYLLHWPLPAEFASTIESYKIVQGLQEESLTCAIGVCNFTPDHLTQLMDATTVVPAVNQVELHPYFPQRELQTFAAQHGIITEAWSPIGGVNVYTTSDTDKQRRVLEEPALRAIAEAHGKTPAQVILRWHLQQGRCAIPKSVNAGRIAENFDVFDFELSPEELSAIDGLDTGTRGGPDPDQVNSTTFS